MRYNLASFAADYARHRRVHPGVLESLLRAGEIGSESRVLEVGCGTGNYIGAIGAITGCHAFGVDPSAHMLRQARYGDVCVHYAVGSAEELPTAGLFDLIYSVDVIHHVRDHGAYIARAHALLRPGGRLCTATDSADIIRARTPLSTYFPETVHADLARYPAISTLRDLVARAGFQQIEEIQVEQRYDVMDPGPYRDKAYSCLRLISEDAFQRGLARLESDLALGPVHGVARYLLLWGTRVA